MPHPLSNAHRRELRTLTNLAENDLATLWRMSGSITSTRDLLTDVLQALTGAYGSAAASLAADYYDDLRELSGARRRFTAIAAETAAPGAAEVLAKVAVGPLFGVPDVAAALVLAKGGLQRHIANADRETVRFSSVQDPASSGWVRVGSGQCDWCQQYLTGEVVSDPGYDFNAHDHCGCTVEPAF